MRRSSDRAVQVRASVVLAALALAGCVELPPDYLGAGPKARADRYMQARRFEGISEKELLVAAVSVLQDLGFAVETAGSELGFVQGTRQAPAKAPEQTLFLSALALAMGASPPVGSMREDQTISVLLSVRPGGALDARSHQVHVSFHTHMRQPMIQTAGPLRDPALYQAFFEQLSKAIFLEAHNL